MRGSESPHLPLPARTPAGTPPVFHEPLTPTDSAKEAMATREATPPGAPGKPAPAAQVATSSPLYKPLAELTEEEIAEVTREEYRRFLKEKGMRRPSWNKSQAIQQVISLKALLEASPDADDDVAASLEESSPQSPLPLLIPAHSPASPSTPPSALAGNPSQIPILGWNLPSPHRRRGPPVPAVSAADDCCLLRPPQGSPVSTDSPGAHPRATAGEAEAPEAQMTIFYDGKVKVYDVVTREKARLIMEFAASSSCCNLQPLLPTAPFTNGFCIIPAHQRPPLVSRGGGGFTAAPAPSLVMASPLATNVSCPLTSQQCDGPNSISASVQQYLDKQKDRLKCDNVGRSASSITEMYLSQKIIDQIPSWQLNFSEMSSPSMGPRPPRTPNQQSSIENPAKKLRIDLNDDDV